MDILRALILGIVQAITEFLPISSSAHLILFREWLGFDSVDGLTFDVALHIGTLVAVVVYFRRDVRWLFRGFLGGLRHRQFGQNIEQRLPWFIVIGTIPAVLIGVAFEGVIESTLRTPEVIVVTLVVGGLLFLFVERVSKQVGGVEDLTLRKALVIGVAQSIALIPGVSRSGITIIAGMSQQIRREQAARFSFLLSIPVMIGAGVKKALDVQSVSYGVSEVLALAVGLVSSALLGWWVIRFLLRFLLANKLNVFAYYRFILAGVIVVWLAV